MTSAATRPTLCALNSDVVRIVLPIPFGLAYVNAYAIRGDDQSWTLVDPGFRTDSPEELWESVFRCLDGPVERVVVTHYHPDHIGGAADAAEVAGADLLQGRRDFDQATAAWGDPTAPEREATYFIEHGMPTEMADAVARRSRELAQRIRLRRPDRFLHVGEKLAGWAVRHYPGHAEGHLALARGRELVGGDVLLAEITPNVGRYPESDSPPLADYLETLNRIKSDGWDVVYSGHRDAVTDPAGRAAQTRAHHGERLQLLRSALTGRQTAYSLSHALFPAQLNAEHRRFAVAETLAHLELLVAREVALQIATGGKVWFESRT